MAVEIGQSAPDFTLVNSDKEQVTLSSLQGNPVLLLFFPMAFTGVCTTELCSIRDGLKEYESLNTKVLGISVDSPFTLAKFKEDQKLNFPLLSDFNKTASKQYGTFYEEFVLGLKGVSKRSVFVIDAAGKIQHKEILESATDLPDFTAVKNALSAL